MILSTLISPYTLLLALILYYTIPYYRNRPLRSIPGPPLAAFSNFWLLLQCRQGKRYLAVDQAHKKYGPLVRLQPNHVSIALPEAIPVVYSHSGGWLKSEYYDAFVSIRRGLFNTRDRAEHTRKRKLISHTFSAKSIAQFEPYIYENLNEFVKQWDRICQAGTESIVVGGTKYTAMDCLHWFNYLAFDIIGDLAFGAPFGMLRRGQDIAEVEHVTTSGDVETKTAPAIEVLNRRGEVSATLGCYPSLKPYAAWLPDAFFRNGVKAVQNLAGIATARVSARLKDEEDNGKASQRMDLLARLMQGRDEAGHALSKEELTAEALTQLIAGSDTTSNTSCAGLYWISRTPGVLSTMQVELDEAIPDDCPVPTYDMVKDLPYLKQVINETLRIHSTSSLGLPRIVPVGLPAPVEFRGHIFPPGTVLSVPSYTIHHSSDIWDPSEASLLTQETNANPKNEKSSAASQKEEEEEEEASAAATAPVITRQASTNDFDPNKFVPERWEAEHLTPGQKASFIPFSTGPRACVGRNVAEMELLLIFATVVRRYDVVLLKEQDGLETREGFLRKPVGCRVGVRRRRRRGNTVVS